MDEYIDNLRRTIEELRAKGIEVRFETHNESFHGQAAINILNGLPPDADPSEVRGCFNDWLQSLELSAPHD